MDEEARPRRQRWSAHLVLIPTPRDSSGLEELKQVKHTELAQKAAKLVNAFGPGKLRLLIAQQRWQIPPPASGDNPQSERQAVRPTNTSMLSSFRLPQAGEDTVTPASYPKAGHSPHSPPNPPTPTPGLRGEDETAGTAQLTPRGQRPDPLGPIGQPPALGGAALPLSAAGAATKGP